MRRSHVSLPFREPMNLPASPSRWGGPLYCRVDSLCCCGGEVQLYRRGGALYCGTFESICFTSAPKSNSSPSTFDPNIEDLLFKNLFQITGSEYTPAMFSMLSQPVSSTKAHSPYHRTSEPPISSAGSPGRSAPVSVAPYPAGLRHLNALKRNPVEEDQLLLKLKHKENLQWKDITALPVRSWEVS